MAALNNERVVQIDFIFLPAVPTKESFLFQSRVFFFGVDVLHHGQQTERTP